MAIQSSGSGLWLTGVGSACVRAMINGLAGTRADRESAGRARPSPTLHFDSADRLSIDCLNPPYQHFPRSSFLLRSFCTSSPLLQSCNPFPRIFYPRRDTTTIHNAARYSSIATPAIRNRTARGPPTGPAGPAGRFSIPESSCVPPRPEDTMDHVFR